MHNRNKAWSRLLLKRLEAKKHVIWFTISPTPSYTHTHSESELKLSWRLWSLQFPIHGNHYPWGKIIHFLPRVLSKERKIVRVCVHMRLYCMCVLVFLQQWHCSRWQKIDLMSSVNLLLLSFSFRLCLSSLSQKLSLFYQSITVKLSPHTWCIH